MEEMAAGLRMWVGTAVGSESGLTPEGRGKIVDLCLNVAKQIGGWDSERDSGYGSVGSAEQSPVRAKARLVTCY